MVSKRTIDINESASKKPKFSENIKVCIRVRPFNESEKNNLAENLLKIDSKNHIIELNKPQKEKERALRARDSVATFQNTRSFKFDETFSSFDPNDKHYVDQETLFRALGLQYLDHVLDGYNACIFAYGQTGSGKSFTMMGSEADPGLIPRICRQLFKVSETLLSKRKTAVMVKVSYFEIYNEMVYDLLGEHDTRSKLKVRESPETGPYVENLKEFSVNDYKEILDLFRRGNEKRKTGSTKMNISSSRSHAIFTVNVKQIEYVNLATNQVSSIKHSSLRLVDLAGSERASQTGAVGQRLKEGSNINKSLTCLGRVINVLAKKEPSLAVPFRDSALTWILKESLCGNSKTAMVACVSPSNYEETLSSLRYASNAKKIKTTATINKDQDKNDEMTEIVKAMQSKIEELESQLQKKGNENENDLVQATQAKISTNYKRFLTMYDEKLLEERNKNKLLVVEINRLEEENRKLNVSLDGIVSQILNEFTDASKKKFLESASTLQSDEDDKGAIRYGLKRSEVMNFANIGDFEISAGKKNLNGADNNNVLHDKENSLPISPNVRNRNKLTELISTFDTLKKSCNEAGKSVLSDLDEYHPKRLNEILGDNTTFTDDSLDL